VITLLAYVIFTITAFWLFVIFIGFIDIMLKEGWSWTGLKNEFKGLMFMVIIPTLIFFFSGVYLFGVW